jgi:transposase
MGSEPMLVQAFVTEFAVGALHLSILSELTGLNEPQLDFVLFGPLVQRFDRELGALIGSNHLRQMSEARGLVQYARDVMARDPIRGALPDYLPREPSVHPALCSCPDCGGILRKIGDVTTEILEIVPSRLKVVRHVRSKYSCATCDTVVGSPAPPRPIPNSYVGASLLAFVVSAKFCYHLAQILGRLGYPVDRSVLTQWARGAYTMTMPLVEALAQHALAAGKLHADDTPFKVLAPGTGRTKKGRLWTYVRDERPWSSGAPPAVSYQYSPSWAGKYPQTYLKDFKGALQADGYKGFRRCIGHRCRIERRKPSSRLAGRTAGVDGRRWASHALARWGRYPLQPSPQCHRGCSRASCTAVVRAVERTQFALRPAFC